MTTQGPTGRPRRTRVPRASLSVTMLDDADLIALLQHREADEAAMAVFVLLIVAAKQQGNGGVFKSPLAVTAAMIRSTEKRVRAAVALIIDTCKANGSEPWLTLEGHTLTVRTYSEWNPAEKRGGARAGAGRPPLLQSEFNDDSERNHIDFNDESESCASAPAPAPVSAPGAESRTSSCSGPSREAFQRQERERPGGVERERCQSQHTPHVTAGRMAWLSDYRDRLTQQPSHESLWWNRMVFEKSKDSELTEAGRQHRRLHTATKGKHGSMYTGLASNIATVQREAAGAAA
jgi:hypothetical protein